MTVSWLVAEGIRKVEVLSGTRLGFFRVTSNIATSSVFGEVWYRFYVKQGAIPDQFGYESPYLVSSLPTNVGIFGIDPVTNQRFLQTPTTYTWVVRAADPDGEDTNLQSITEEIPKFIFFPVRTVIDEIDTNDLFPLTPHYSYTDSIRLRSVISRFESGTEQRKQMWTRPLKQYQVRFNPLSDAEINQLWRFFLDHNGPVKSFLFLDLSDRPFEEVVDPEGDEIYMETVTESGKYIRPNTFELWVGDKLHAKDDGNGKLKRIVDDVEIGWVDYEKSKFFYNLVTEPLEPVKIVYEIYRRVRFGEEILEREMFAYKIYSSGITLMEVS